MSTQRPPLSATASLFGPLSEQQHHITTSSTVTMLVIVRETDVSLEINLDLNTVPCGGIAEQPLGKRKAYMGVCGSDYVFSSVSINFNERTLYFVI